MSEQQFHNTTSNEGAQGNFYGPVTFNQGGRGTSPGDATHQLRAPVADFVG
ncbi:MAG: hypothetical protein HC876_16395, partial [Chloroflexaceae bacterium]|nr:hypothetical protein [Chloroflexaceae bacterium]